MPLTISSIHNTNSGCQYPLPLKFAPGTMIHHNPYRVIYRNRLNTGPLPYGVSSFPRVISPGLVNRRWDMVISTLRDTLGLTTAQRHVVMQLLRLWCYYGQVYPKASQLCADPGCSTATFWRSVKMLEAQGLLSVVNRYLQRHNAQISNLYRLDRLLMVIARYLAERGQKFTAAVLQPMLSVPGSGFWRVIFARTESP